MISDDKSMIEVVCGVDQSYAPHLAALLKSIEDTQSRPVRAHVLHDSLSLELREKVQQATASIEIRWYSITNDEVLSLSPLLQISRATYFRLLLDKVLNPEISRVLYLDVDVVVSDSLDTIWDMNLCGHACAAVPDPGISAEAFARKFFLGVGGSYFNAGVILLDMDELRRLSALEKALSLLLADRPRYEFADQDALNVVLWRRWLQIDSRWNFQRSMLYGTNEGGYVRSLEKPAIIHFTESQKPWQRFEWHPYQWLYLKSLKKTPFFTEVKRAGQITAGDQIKSYLRYVLRTSRTTR